jgi:hypothetical protein
MAASGLPPVGALPFPRRIEVYSTPRRGQAVSAPTALQVTRRHAPAYRALSFHSREEHRRFDTVSFLESIGGPVAREPVCRFSAHHVLNFVAKVGENRYPYWAYDMSWW